MCLFVRYYYFTFSQRSHSLCFVLMKSNSFFFSFKVKAYLLHGRNFICFVFMKSFPSFWPPFQTCTWFVITTSIVNDVCTIYFYIVGSCSFFQRRWSSASHWCSEGKRWRENCHQRGGGNSPGTRGYVSKILRFRNEEYTEPSWLSQRLLGLLTGIAENWPIAERHDPRRLCKS